MFHTIIYKFKEYIVEQNEILLREGDDINNLIIVKQGEFEMVMVIDGIELVVARIGTGCVLNHRNLFMPGEKMFLTVRCSKRAIIMIIASKQLDKLKEEREGMSSRILKFVNKLYK